MQAELITTIKDITAMSGISERTAKRRLSELPKSTPFRDLRRYCKFYGINFEKALEFKIAKRYDPLFRNYSKKHERRFYSYTIDTWEEPYRLGLHVHKVLFHELNFIESKGSRISGSMRYFTFPTALLESADYLHLAILKEFSEKVLPVDQKADLLQQYGLMVVKRSRQKRITLVDHVDVIDERLTDFVLVLKNQYSNSKKIWFCKRACMSETQLRAFGFRKIEGTEFAVAGVPGAERFGKPTVWIYRGDEG
jgi:hypothetical protein